MEGEGGSKKNCSSLAVKRGIIGASGRRLLCHLAYSIPRKSHWVIRSRGGERSNQTPIQARLATAPAGWLAGWLGRWRAGLVLKPEYQVGNQVSEAAVLPASVLLSLHTRRRDSERS